MADRRVSETSNLSRVNPGEDEAGDREGSPAGSVMKDPDHVSVKEPEIDDRWFIDPNSLYIGPKIGEGGHSKVYEGRYKSSSVAIKIIQPGSTAEEHARQMEKFLREIMMLSRVQHENLVKFIGACKDPNMVIVTELLSGGSLKKFLRSLRPGCLDLQLSVRFALDISRAMEFLHANGLIHRDLKPDNLLLTGDHKKLKLADFGLAREETVTEMMTSETGTYRWMAPELCSTVTLHRGDKKHYNHKVDIYSFSMVLWELLTNRTPFEGMSNLQASYAAAFKKARPSVDGIPKDLVALLESCWEEDPGNRPEFEQITGALTSFLSSLACVQTTPPPIELAQRNYLQQVDSPGTRHLMDRSREEEDEAKSGRNSSKGIFGCFNECCF